MAAAEEVGVAKTTGPERLEGVADGADTAALGEMKEGTGNGREEVGVFVGVEVGDVDAGTLEFLDLGESFALDVIFIDVVAEECLSEVEEGGAEGFAVGTEEGRDAVGVGCGDAVGEDDVAAYGERGVAAGDGDSVVEGRAGGHEGRGGERAEEV